MIRSLITSLLCVQGVLSVLLLALSTTTIPPDYLRVFAAISLACVTVSGFALEEMRDP